MPTAKIDNAAASGDLTLVAAVGGKKISVTSYVLVVAGAVNVYWRDGAGGTALSGSMQFALGGQGASVSGLPNPVTGSLALISTSQGNALVLNISGAVQVGGHLTYELR
jgi:hypothetical protein